MIDLEKNTKHGIGILNSSFSGRYSTHQLPDKYSHDLLTIKYWWANQRVRRSAFRGALELYPLNTLDLTRFSYEMNRFWCIWKIKNTIFTMKSINVPIVKNRFESWLKFKADCLYSISITNENKQQND